MTRRFESLSWHDAVVLSVEIDRRKPGAADEVRVAMLWPDGRCSTIAFLDCYALSAKMNFGVLAQESVRTASEEENDPELDQHRDRWSRLGVELAELKKFTIETNSTASTVTVLALRWEEREGELPR